MKQLLFICLLFIANLINAQSGPVRIQGKISNNTATKVVIHAPNEQKFELDIDKNNEVTGFITTTEGIHKMHIGEEFTTIYLVPRSSLNFTIDLKEFDESISYTGMLAAENNILAKQVLLEEKFNAGNGANFKLSEKEFLKLTIDYFSTKTALLSSDKLNVNFKNTELNKAKFSKYNQLLQYPGYHKYFTKNDSFEVSKAYYDFLKEIDFNDAANLKNENIGIVDEYLDYNINKNKKGEFKDDEYTVAKLGYLQSLITNEDVKSNYLKSSYKSNLVYGDNPMTVGQAMIDATNNVTLKSEISEFMNKLNTLSEGKHAPAFDLLSASGANKSLASFKGKYVYIDVWATWCGPCKKELPHYETLKKDYAGKNIEFVSICVWDSKEAWDNFLVKKELKGNQLFIAGQDNDFVNNYMIQGVPTFILIDKEGKIITRQVERPSDKAVRERLDKLVN